MPVGAKIQRYKDPKMNRMYSHRKKYDGRILDMDYFMGFTYPLMRHMRHFLMDYNRKEGVTVDMVCNITRVILESRAGNLREAQNVAAVFSMEVYFTVRGYSLILVREKFGRVLDTLGEMLPRNMEEQRRMGVPEMVKTIEKRFFLLHGYVGIANVAFVFVPLLRYVIFFDESGPLLDDYVQNPSWLPFGLKQNPKYYYYVYVWSTYLSLAGIFHATSHDHAFTVAFAHLIMHFKYLAKRLREVSPAESQLNEEGSEFWREFKECLMYYRKLKDLSSDINDTFNTSIFASDAVCSATICFLIYLLVNTDDVLLIFTFGIPLGVMVWCTYDFSCRGEDLEGVSSEVLDIFYDTNWYEGSLIYQKQLIQCLQHASRPCKLTALHMFDVNMQHFRKMMSLAYQMFAFLQR